LISELYDIERFLENYKHIKGVVVWMAHGIILVYKNLLSL